MKIRDILTENSDPKVIEIAQHMVKRYSELAYTPYERAVDHAFSYDRDQPQHRYWLAVADEILRIESQKS